MFRTSLLSNIALCLIAILLTIGCSKNSSSPGNQPPSPPDNTPKITAIRPTHAPGGSADTISGSGFKTSTSLDSVYINGVKAAVVAASDTQLVVTVPALAGTGKISLIENAATINGPLFTYDTIFSFATFAQGLAFPQHLVTDRSGNVYATDKGDGTVAKIAPDGTISSFTTGLTNPIGIAKDADDNIYVADNGTNGPATIYKYNPQGSRTLFANVNAFLWTLTCDNTGFIYATWDNTVNIVSISPSGTLDTLIRNAGGGVSFGLCPNPAGGLYVTSDKLYTFSAGGTLANVTLTGNTTGFNPVDVLVLNNSIYVASFSNNSVYRISFNGQIEAIYTGNLNGPFGLGVDNSGNLLVTGVTAGASPAGLISKLTYK